MAKRAMWLAREDHRFSSQSYIVCASLPKMKSGFWYGAEGCYQFDVCTIDPDQSPVKLPPGGGPVRVWFVSYEPE